MIKHSIPVGQSSNQWIYCQPNSRPTESEILDAIVEFTTRVEMDMKVFRFIPRFEITNRTTDESSHAGLSEEWMKAQTSTTRGDVQWYADVYFQ